jgi:para-aminobenzoate synthetase component 1
VAGSHSTSSSADRRRVRVRRLGPGASVPEVLRALARRAEREGLAPPAAVTGSWFGSHAIIAPSLATGPVDVPSVLGTAGRPGPVDGVVGGGWFTALRYPDDDAESIAATGGWTDSVLRLDGSGCWWFESLSGERCPPEIGRAVRFGGVEHEWSVDWTPPDGAAHRAAVRQCLAAIAAGEVYQTCVCTRFTGALHGSPVDLFADGIEACSPERAALIAGDGVVVVSFSPELFLARHGDKAWSSPIKGTLPLSADPALLRGSPKEVAENIMIVDLVRNDLGQVCEIGSVTVPELLRVRPAPGVWHLVSTVAGDVPAHVTDDELVAAMFPPGSVTGAPKSRACYLMRRWERAPRGVYCGAAGLVSPLAGLELNVAIRTVEVDAAGMATLGVGGGITADSDPEAEWQECLTKGRAVTSLVARAQRTLSLSP